MDALDRLRQKTAAAGADGLLITTPANVRYLSGFTAPADGRILVTPEAATLITDGRYTAQVKEESRLPFEINASSSDWLGHVIDRVKGKKLAIESENITLDKHAKLAAGLGTEPILTEGWVSDLRLIKSAQEIEAIRQAAEIADAAFSHILNVIKAGLSEVEVALELERHMRLAGAERKAFDITVASGYRSSMPHGTASAKIIATGELVTLDFGAVVDGYNSDMTRTIAVGQISDRDRKMYDAVKAAEETALAAIAPEKDGKAIDKIARDVLASYELDSYFTHSLGHGVGLDVHEAPSLSFRKSEMLKPGMVVTVEPGAYIPGEAGVRVEDLVLVTETGYDCMSHSDKAFIQL